MLQFEDLQCPICKQYTDNAFSAIVNEYVRPGRVKIDFRGLAFLGPDSLKALKIAVAAGFQNKLWQVVGLFYENQGPENSGWVTDALIDRDPGGGAGPRRGQGQGGRQTASPSRTRSRRSQKEATDLNVQGTPSFFFGVGVSKPSRSSPAHTSRASSGPPSTRRSRG